jgi:hypothetical protein
MRQTLMSLLDKRDFVSQSRDCKNNNNRQVCDQLLDQLRSGHFKILDPVEESDHEADLKRYQKMRKHCFDTKMWSEPGPDDWPHHQLPNASTRGFALYRVPPELVAGKQIYIHRSEDIVDIAGNPVGGGMFDTFEYPSCKRGPAAAIYQSHPSALQPQAPGQELRWFAAPVVIGDHAYLVTAEAYNQQPKQGTSILMGLVWVSPNAHQNLNLDWYSK